MNIEQRQDDRIAALEQSIVEIRDLLKPISETYSSVTRMGKWAMTVAVFISIVIGIIMGLRSFLNR